MKREISAILAADIAGDAILAEFDSAVDGVRCAMDVQDSLRARNLAHPRSRQMAFRIGITIGDVTEPDGDLLGDAVNIAARRERLAVPGGICFSRSTQIANKVLVKFVDIGLQQVNNVPAPAHVYRTAAGTPDENAGRQTRAADWALRSKRASVALPGAALFGVFMTAGVATTVTTAQEDAARSSVRNLTDGVPAFE